MSDRHLICGLPQLVNPIVNPFHFVLLNPIANEGWGRRRLRLDLR